MNNISIPLLFSAVVCLSPLVAHANTSHPLYEQIQFYEYSVTQSSVSPIISEQRKREKLDLLSDARRHIETGDYAQARSLMRTVAQNLYSMSPEPVYDQSLLTIHKTTAILEAMDSLLPEAQRISREKQANQEQLEQIMREHQLAKTAIRSHDLVTASALLQNAYRQLKQNLAQLRSGDLLMISLPAADSREGWMDAATRYIDWRYLNRQLQQEMRQRGMDTNDIDQARENADHLYNSASDIALQGDWEQAVETADQAYRILEKAWRDNGIDIGV